LLLLLKGSGLLISAFALSFPSNPQTSREV
jgi:hypothetical protein